MQSTHIKKDIILTALSFCIFIEQVNCIVGIDYIRFILNFLYNICVYTANIEKKNGNPLPEAEES